MKLNVAIAGFGRVGQRRYNFIKKEFNVISISDQFIEYRKNLILEQVIKIIKRC